MKATAGTRALAEALQQLKLPEGVVLLNSCAPGEVSWEDEEFGHGVFMHYVLDGLGGKADADGDGAVSLMELQGYAGGNTKTYVANRHRVAQRPFFKGDLSTEALAYALLPVPGKRDSDWGYAWIPVAGPLLGGLLAAQPPRKRSWRPPPGRPHRARRHRAAERVHS